MVIEFLNFIGTALDNIGSFLGTDFGMVATLTTVLMLGTTILGNKLREYGINQAMLTQQRAAMVTAKQKQLLETKMLIAEKKQVLEAKKQAELAEFIVDLEQIEADLKMGKMTGAQAEMLQAQAKVDYMKDEARLQAEIADLETQEVALNSELGALGAANKYQ